MNSYWKSDAGPPKVEQPHDETPQGRRPRPAKSPAVYYGHLAAQRSRHAQAVIVHRIQRIRAQISDSTAKILRLGIRAIGGLPSRIRPDPITGF